MYFSKCHGHYKQEKSEKLTKQRGTREDMTFKGYAVFWIGSWNRREY